MLRHYLISALRNFWRFPFSTAINVLGLSFGVVCFIASYAAIDSLGRSDQNWAKAPRIVALVGQFSVGKSEQKFPPFAVIGASTAKYLKADFPELEKVARGLFCGEMAVSAGTTKIFLQISAADPEFLDIFDLPFIAGDSKTALSAPHSAILTEDAANRLFGSLDVIGRRLLLQNRVDVTVTGVIAKIPEPTHIGARPGKLLWFDILVPADLRPELSTAFDIAPQDTESWLNSEAVTYGLLPADGSLTLAALNARLASFGERHVPPALGKGKFTAVPISQLLSVSLGILTGGLPLASVLFVPSLLVLAIACLNYANLATALRAARAKEIGMRKILGARRGQIMSQYLLEALLLGLVALALVLVGIALALPLLEGLVRIGLHVPSLLDPGFWGFLLLILALVVVLGGAYPAWALSAARPVEAMRTGLATAGRRFVPSLFVGIQFTAASFLLIVVMVMYNQNAMLRRIGPTTAEDPIVVIRTNIVENRIDFETLRGELMTSPLIKSVTAVSYPPWVIGLSSDTFVRSSDAAAKPLTVKVNAVNYDYFETLGTTVLAGRVFARERGEDVTKRTFGKEAERPVNIVIDRALAQQFGWSTPEAAVGQTIFRPNLRDVDAPPLPAQIIGVIENKPTSFLGFGLTSNVYVLVPSETGFPVIRLAKGDIPAALAHIDAVWDKLSPDVPLKRQFMSELFESSYVIFSFILTVIGGLAAFAFVVAVMGLLGMAVFITSGRVREIGIRKTMGASAGQIVVLLLRDFSKPVLIANVIAWPLAFLGAQPYLRLFIERAPLTPVPFVLSLVVTLLIAWVAVGAQAFGAARVKPADVLRYE